MAAVTPPKQKTIEVVATPRENYQLLPLRDGENIEIAFFPMTDEIVVSRPDLIDNNQYILDKPYNKGNPHLWCVEHFDLKHKIKYLFALLMDEFGFSYEYAVFIVGRIQNNSFGVTGIFVGVAAHGQYLSPSVLTLALESIGLNYVREELQSQ